MQTCRNCFFGDNPYDHCGIDGKNIRVIFWGPCDRHEYEPGCDIEEMDEYLAIVMAQGADVKGAYIELTYSEDCI